jgi:hypothetical protein
VLQVSLPDDVKEDIRGIGGVALIAELVDDEDVGVDVRLQGAFHAASLFGARESSPISGCRGCSHAFRPNTQEQLRGFPEFSSVPLRRTRGYQ